MRSRKIRVPAVGVLAHLGPGSGELLNVSLTGALVELDQEVPVGSSWPLRMSQLEVSSRVVRCAKAPGFGQASFGHRWLVAVVFGELSPAAGRAVRALVSEMYQRTGASRT